MPNSTKPCSRAGDMVTIVIDGKTVDKMMIDTRPRKGRQRLGTPRECLAQYGLSLTELEGRAYIKAPRNRMQLFLEKIHYAAVKYTVVGTGV